MAKLTNELTIDVSKFLGNLKRAEAAVEGLDQDIDVKLNADVGEASKLESALNDSAAAAEEVAIQSAKIGDSLKGAAEGGSGLGGFFDGLKEKVGGLGGLGQAAAGGLGGIVSAIPIPQVAAIAGAVTAVGGALVGIVEAGKAANDALKNIALQTGATEEELAVLEDQASKAFMMGVGESSAEAIEMIGKFRTTLKGVVPDDFLGEAAAKTNVLAKSLGVDTPKLLTGATRLSQKFGITYDDALAQISAASQNGVSDIDGMLDALDEFSGNAAEAGLSADEFRAVLQTAGAAGVKDFGKIGDGIKELNNRIKSGDLASSVSQVAGPIGETLQGITRLAEEGTITAQEAAQQSIAAIEKARAAGEINEATRGELFTLFGGSVAEDLGSELYAKVYGAPIPEDEIAKQAGKAGALIDKRLAQQDPIDKLKRAFEDGITDIGKVLVGFYTEFVAPIINPIIDVFLRIKQAIGETFSGDGLDTAKSFFSTLQEVITGLISTAIEPIALAWEVASSVIKTVISTLSDAFAPLIDAFSAFGGEADDTTSIFDTLKDVMGTVANVFKSVLAGAIRFLFKPLELLVQGIASLVTFVGKIINAIPGAIQQFKDWALSFDFVRDAAQTLGEWIISLQTKVSGFISSVAEFIGIADSAGEATEDLAAKQKEAAAKTAAWQKEVTGLIKANALTEDSINKIADAYGVSADEIRAFADANRAAILTAAGDVNQLADNFNNALSAAQASLGKYIAAVAGGAKQFTDEARKAQAEARKLEAAQDRAQFAIDPLRQKQVAQQRAQAAAETLRRERELAAELIANAQERDRELLKISQESAAKLLDDQIELQEATIKAGGAGGPEAQAALAALLQERNRLVLDQERERVTLEGSFAQTRLNNLIAAEEKARNAVAAINDRTLAILEKQFASFNLSGDTLSKLIAARTEQITKAAEAEVRGLIDSLPEFTRGVEEIFAKVGAGLINEEEAQKQIAALRTTIEQTLLAGDLPGADLIAQQIRTIREGASDASAEVAKQTARAFRDAGISQTSSEILRSIDEQVAGLEDQRDLLLQNVALTAEQRAEIERGFALAIDKVRRGPVRDLQASLFGIAASVQEFKFEIDVEEAAENANMLADETAKINEQLRAGEITYQEAIERLNALESAAIDTQSVLADVAGQALTQLAESARTQVTQTLDYMNQIRADIAKVYADTTIDADKRKQELERLNDKLVDSTSNAYAQIGIAAGTAFASALASGEDAFKSLVLVALDALQALIPILTAQIFGINVASPNPANVTTLGGAGIAAAAATTAILQGLVAVARAAVAGFKDGGYTGNGGVNDVAGVVHGREFVVNARATSKYRDVLEAINAGKDIDLLARDKRSSTFVDINGGLHTVATIMSDVRDRLDRIPDQAFMKQQVGVDVSLDDRLYERQRFRKQVRNLR